MNDKIIILDIITSLINKLSKLNAYVKINNYD